MTRWWRVASWLQTGAFLLGLPLAAQVRTGEFTDSLSGTIAPGYTAEYGNQTPSNHSWALAGAGTLSGSFYNPNFLSYNSSFYLNQSRANSDFQSISNASGVNASSSIFGGSHFPGSVTYSKAFSSDGNYDLPGLANYVTHGNSDTFSVNWSESVPSAPSFSAGFQAGTSQYSVYGLDDQGNNAFHSVNLHSSYDLKGFGLGVYFTTGASNALIPQILADEPSAQERATSNSTGFNVSHALPMQGSVSTSFNRSSWSSSFLGSTSSGTIDMVNALASVHPTQKVALSLSADYSDNLNGQLIESILGAGGAAPGLNSDQSSNSMDVMATATYTPAPSIQTSVFTEARTQTFLGESYGVTSFGGSASYAHKLLDGNFSSSVTLTDNLNDQSSENSLGFSTNDNFTTLIRGWHVNASFGYAQNVQTLLISYTNSFYNYSFNARHNWGKFNVSGGTSQARTAVTQEAGTASGSQSYDASFGFGQWISANGSYSHASGQALTTGAGLVSVPIPTPVLPSSLVSLYGGNSYSIGLASTPVKRLILSGSWSSSTSNIASGGLSSANQTSQFNAIIQYQTRKLYYSSGFARLEQGFSGSGSTPGIVSTYSIGVSRWFNFF